MRFFNVQESDGFSLIEVVIAMALFLSVVAIFGSYYSALRTSLLHSERVSATLLAEEGLEVLRILRDQGWDSFSDGLSMDDPYWIAFDGSTWELTPTPQAPIDSLYDRRIVFTEVYRDGNDRIDTSGTVDPGTLYAKVTVEWPSGPSATSTYELGGYFSEIF